jgi:hypothetical protein
MCCPLNRQHVGRGEPKLAVSHRVVLFARQKAKVYHPDFPKLRLTPVTTQATPDHDPVWEELTAFINATYKYDGTPSALEKSSPDERVVALVQGGRQLVGGSSANG